MELSSSNISQKKAFLIFRGMKLYYILGKGNLEKIHYISGDGNPEKSSLYFRRELPGSKNEKDPHSKCFLYFGKWNFLASILKNFVIFQEITCTAWKSKTSYFLFAEIELFKDKCKRTIFFFLLFLIKQA